MIEQSSNHDTQETTLGAQAPDGRGGAATLGQPADTIPKHIGRYAIKRAIGSGGMGSVYEAVQEQPRRTVALKVMKTGIASRSALRRFEYESQLLARLRHPGIAQVYDAGTHDDGEVRVPYFAMEYIAGAARITEYVNSKTLSARDKLELFLQVCDAVHHGHTKGVIHRDLKPDNILVDAHGRVKVIDFGVARATDSDLAVTTLQTQLGQLVGTVQYMSPEQVDSDPQDLDTRSDVYSLGVVLYQMLTGKVPYDVTGMQIHQATRVVREQTATRLSTVHAQLRGDVETIVLKALEKDRERRYQSAENLAADIRRFLKNEPITARPPSLSYQIRVFARRNRPLVVGVAAVFVALLAGVIVSTVLYVQADTARRDAETARQDEADARNLAVASRREAEDQALRARQSMQLLQQLLIPSDDPSRDRGLRLSVGQLLDEFAAGLDAQVAGNPGVAVELHETLGKAFFYIDQPEKSLTHLRTAVSLYEQLDRSREAGELKLLIARSLASTGRSMEAADAYRDLATAKRAANADAGQDQRAHLAQRAAEFYLAADDAAQAESMARRCLALCDSQPDAPPERIAEAQLLLGESLIAQGRFTDAEPPLRTALEGFQASVREDDPRIDRARLSLGNALLRCGRAKEAEPYLVMGVWKAAQRGAQSPQLRNTARGVLDIVTSPMRKDATRQFTIKMALLRANARARDGDWEAAQNAFDEAVANDPDSPTTWDHIGTVFARYSRWTDAAAAYERINQIEPENAEAWFRSALLHRQLIDFDRFTTCALTLIERAKTNPAVRPKAALLVMLLPYAFDAATRQEVEPWLTDNRDDESSGKQGLLALARALMAARRGKAEPAAQSAMGLVKGNDALAVAASYVLAIAYDTPERRGDARNAWQDAERAVEARFPRGVDDLGNDWPVWLACWQLRAEASRRAHGPQRPRRQGER